MFSTPEISCPAAGCSARYKKSDLRPNKDLENRVKAHERREKEKERMEREERERAGVDITIDDDDDDDDF